MEILRKVFEFVMDILETVTFVGSLFIVVYLFIMQPHQVEGKSMYNTFDDGDYILTNKLAYRFGPYQRGDVVVFNAPNPEENEGIDFIKRIIAIPGDTVKVQGGRVYVNDTLLKEPYIETDTEAIEGGVLEENQEITVPDGSLFVMGDNRGHSSDSRVFGPIPMRDIVGKVFFRYFPAGKVGVVENPLESYLMCYSYC